MNHNRKDQMKRSKLTVQYPYYKSEYIGFYDIVGITPEHVFRMNNVFRTYFS